MSPKLRWGAASDIGLVREVNEDAKLHEPPLFVVADGMGGHLAGDVASGLAIETLSRTGIRSAGTLPEAVREANRAIFEKASSDEGLSGMGTTIIAMYAEDHSAQIVHVGDCRAYLLRQGRLQRLTQDHTVVERLVQEGRIQAEDADRHPQRSYLERALGVDPQVEVEVNALDTQPGDRFLLCSDGLFGMIDDDRILQILTSEEDPEKAARRLCQEAVEAGGRDNVTVIVIDYASNGRPVAGMGKTGAHPSGTALPSQPAALPTPTRIRPAGGGTAPRRRTVLLVLGGLLVLGAAAAIGTIVVRNSWYVGISGDRVAIFQGVNGSIGGLSLSNRDSLTDLEAGDVPSLYRRRLRSGIPAEDREDAESIVQNLTRLARPEPSPSPGPTQAPPPSPEPVPPAPMPAAAPVEAPSQGVST